MTEKTQNALTEFAHNSERGEVPFFIDGVKFVLCARMDRLASLMNYLKVYDLNEIRDRVFPGYDVVLKRISDQDAQDHDSTIHNQDLFDLRHTFWCAKFLCISHNPEVLDHVLRYCHLMTVGEAVLRCLYHGVAEQQGDAPEKKTFGPPEHQNNHSIVN
ncbi:MAG: hypothetical protein AAF228_04775 [Pseudomonadota bacterium]